MRQTLLAVAAAVVLTAGIGCAERFEAALTAGQVVEPTKLSATGHADFSYDKDKQELSYKIKVNDIADTMSATVHFGAFNTNGETVLVLFAGKKDGVFSGKLVEGKATGANLVGPLKGKPLEDLAASFRNAGAYVLVTNGEEPDGAIRGQIKKKPVWKLW